jgi:thiaminase
MFKKSFEGQLEHYVINEEQKRVEKILEEITKQGKDVVEDMISGKRELEKLKDIRESLTNREYIQYLENAHGKSMKEEVEEALQKIEHRYQELIERQKEGADLMKEHSNFISKIRSRIIELEVSKDQFYEDMLTILNEKELPNKDLV